MELIIKGNIIQFDKLPTAEEIVGKINELLSHKYYYSHLIVDGEEIYDDPENYLFQSLESITRIEVAVKTVQEFVNEVLIMAMDYFLVAIPEMTVLADGFYKNPTSEDWMSFSSMLEGMQWLNHSIDLIDKAKERPMNWDECIKLAVQLQMELKNLEDAIENTDYVLIADIILYELLPIYKDLQTEFITTIDTEVERYDLN